jgi:hypothetical protein
MSGDCSGMIQRFFPPKHFKLSTCRERNRHTGNPAIVLDNSDIWLLCSCIYTENILTFRPQFDFKLQRRKFTLLIIAQRYRAIN